MQLSYAQNLEDTTLARVFHDVAAGTYVDVGGGHPVADNVSMYFYLKGWRGLVVEPQARLAAAYAGIRPRDVVASCLAGRASGAIDFHVFDGMHGLSSAILANAESASKLGLTARVETKTVEPLSVLIDRAGLTAIDFLKIDVEGAEPDVIAGLDLARHRPRVILVEAINPNNPDAAVDSWEPALLAAAYRFVYFDNLNRFYVASEHAAALVQRFPPEPLAWDSVSHLWDWGRAADRPAHPDRRLADVLVAGLFAELPRLAAEHPLLLETLLSRGLAADGVTAPTVRELAPLIGAGEQPRPLPRGEPADVADLLATDQFRAALGRIACMYDGGHLLE